MYHLSIVTPENVVFEGQVVSLTAPGTVGQLQILTDHAPLITTLQAGEVTIIPDSASPLVYSISGGLLEVSHNEVSLLADAIV